MKTLKFIFASLLFVLFNCNGVLDNINENANFTLKTNWEVINVDLLELGLFGNVKSIKQIHYNSSDSVNWSSEYNDYSYEFYENGKLKATISDEYNRKYLYKYDTFGNWISLTLLNLSDSIISSIAIKYMDQKAYWGEHEFILDGMGRISERKSSSGNISSFTSFIYVAQETIPQCIRAETNTNGISANVNIDSLFYNKDQQIVKKVNISIWNNKDTTVRIREYTFGNKKETLIEQVYTQVYTSGSPRTEQLSYKYLEFDDNGNWTKRIQTFGTNYTKQERQISYY